MRKQAIATLGDFYGGLSGKTKDDFVKGNSKYISYMNVYSHPSVELDNCDYVEISKNESQNNIQYGDILFTGSSETAGDCGMSSVVTKEPNEPIYLNSFCFGLRFKELKDKEPSFYKHYFRCYTIRKQISAIAFGVTRFNLSKKEFGKIQIVVPDLVTQKKIANQLDTFTTLISRLESELELRQKQYEHYREELLNFEGDEEVEWKTLGDVGVFIRGNGIKKSDFSEEGYNCIHYGQIYTSYGFSTEDTISKIPYTLYSRSKKASYGDVILATTSENIEDVGKPLVWLGEEDAAVSTDAFIFNHNQLPKYIGHLFLTYSFFNYKKMKANGTKVIRISGEDLASYPFPCIPLDRQQQIVSQLDTFEQLISALKREIALRRKQYEYYREKLLTFD